MKPSRILILGGAVLGLGTGWLAGRTVFARSPAPGPRRAPRVFADSTAAPAAVSPGDVDAEREARWRSALHAAAADHDLPEPAWARCTSQGCVASWPAPDALPAHADARWGTPLGLARALGEAMGTSIGVGVIPVEGGHALVVWESTDDPGEFVATTRMVRAAAAAAPQDGGTRPVGTDAPMP